MAETEKRTVVVLTQPFDPHADPVVRELGRRGVDVFRFDTGDFPTDVDLMAWQDGPRWRGTLRSSSGVGGRTVDLSDIRSIWYRRPSRFRFSDSMPREHRDFARAESLAALGGILRTVQCRWISHPDNLAVAAYKPFQLLRANARGLLTPKTFVTNVPSAARRFYDEHRPGVIYKTLGSQQTVGDDGFGHVVFTSLIEERHLSQLDRVRNAPCCFQEYIPKRVELRVTVFGDKVYTVAIEPKSASPRSMTDWRTDIHDLRYSTFELPPEIERSCRALVSDLGLSFGAIDMIVTPDDRFIFLEINANGQWLWLEEATGLPMTDTLIDLLVG